MSELNLQDLEIVARVECTLQIAFSRRKAYTRYWCLSILFDILKTYKANPIVVRELSGHLLSVIHSAMPMGIESMPSALICNLESLYARHRMRSDLREPFFLHPLQPAIAVCQSNKEGYEQIQRNADSTNADLQEHSHSDTEKQTLVIS